MDAAQVLAALKDKALPVFGTLQEKKDRLKKASGIEVFGQEQGKKLNVLENIKRIEIQREERRLKQEEHKIHKQQREMQNHALGKNIDCDFDLLLEQEK